tara:strand:+ start:2562 stop:2858 length:297 start_codon:yes stop_codon:yes gene_type:complete
VVARNFSPTKYSQGWGFGLKKSIAIDRGGLWGACTKVDAVSHPYDADKLNLESIYQENESLLLILGIVSVVSIPKSVIAADCSAEIDFTPGPDTHPQT